MKIILSALLVMSSSILFAQKPEPPPPPPPSGDRIFQKVEVEPAFPGGEKIWKQYLLKNLKHQIPLDNGAPSGTYTVVVEFLVDKDGLVSDVRALTNHGFGMEEEAMRMIKKGPKWVAGIQNGRNVKMYKKQPITFIVAD